MAEKAYSSFAGDLYPTSFGAQGGHYLVNNYMRRKVPVIL